MPFVCFVDRLPTVYREEPYFLFFERPDFEVWIRCGKLFSLPTSAVKWQSFLNLVETKSLGILHKALDAITF